jgi:hypothetical protein
MVLLSTSGWLPILKYEIFVPFDSGGEWVMGGEIAGKKFFPAGFPAFGKDRFLQALSIKYPPPVCEGDADRNSREAMPGFLKINFKRQDDREALFTPG